MSEDNNALETSILDALKQMADHGESERKTIDIKRKGERVLSFSVRALSEEEVDRCRELNTRSRVNRRLGVKVPEKINAARYHSQMIYEATVPEDRKAIWDCREMWQYCNVASGVDLVDEVLLAGEKERVIDEIEKLSGFAIDDDDENGLEDTIKN